MEATIMPNPDAPPLIGQPHVLEPLTKWTVMLKHPKDYPIPRLVIFGGGSGVGKGTAVKLLAKQSGCKLFFPPPRFFANDLARIPELFRFANDKGKEERRHCIVFLDEVDDILNNASKAKVNTFKGTLENAKSCYPNIMIVCATNHFDKLSTDVGAESRTSNRITFNPQTPAVIQQMIEFNFKHMDMGATEVRMSVDDWKTLLPTMMGQNGHTLDAWCVNVSGDVAYRYHHADDKGDKFIRLEDMQRVTMGLRVVPLNPTTVADVSTLSDEDKERAIKEWIAKTFMSNGADRMDREVMQEMIHFYNGVILHPDIMPDDILMCAGISPANLTKVRSLDSSKALWDSINDNPLTAPARKTFEKCFRQVYATDNKVQLIYKTKDQIKFPITREVAGYDGGSNVVGYNSRVDRKSTTGRKVLGYYLLGLMFSPQWRADSPMFKCIEWAQDLGLTAGRMDLGFNKRIVGLLFESYPTFTVPCIQGLLCYVPGSLRPPELVSVGDVGIDSVNNKHLIGASCTFKHPSGALVQNMWMEISTLREHYPDKVQHLAQSSGS